MLAASYALARKRKAVWIQLDSDDADPGTFFHYARLAFAINNARDAAKLPLPDSALERDWSRYARRFGRTLFPVLAEGGTLVLDNVNEIAGSETETLIATLAEEMPAGARLVLTHRSPPPAAFARLIARQLVKVIDWQDIQLREDEVQALWTRLAPGRDAELKEVHRLAAGWASGVVLLASRTRVDVGDDSLSNVVTRDALFPYFADQVLDQLPTQAQDTLMACALFDRFTVTMAAIITMNPDVARPLRQVADRQLFLMSFTTNDGTEWLQFHPLFHAFLRARLKARISESAWRARHGQAAEVLEKSGQLVMAVRAWQVAGDAGKAGAIAVKLAPTLIREGRHALLKDLLDSIPDSPSALAPWIKFWGGIASIEVLQEGTESLFARARELFQEAGDSRGKFFAACGEHYVSYVYGKRPSKDMPGREDIKANVRQWLSNPPDEEPSLELIALCGVGVAILWTGQVDVDPAPMIERLSAACDASPDPSLTLCAATVMLNVADSWRQHTRALPLIGAFDRVAAQPSITLARRAHWYFSAGYFLSAASFHLSRPKLRADASDYADKALAAASEGEYDGILFDIHRLRVEIAWQADDFTTARAALKEARRHVSAQHPHQLMDVHNRAAIIALRGSEPEEALEEARHAELEGQRAGFEARSYSYSTWLHATALFRLNRFADAQRKGAEAAEAAPPGHGASYRLGLLCWEADEKLNRGDPDAEPALIRAFKALCEQQVYIIGLLYRDTMRRISLAALDKGIEVPFTQELVRRQRFLPGHPAPRHWPWPIRVRAFGGLQIELDGHPLAFERKTPKKPLELMLRLTAQGSDGDGAGFRPVAADRLIEDLWPDPDASDSRKALESAIHRLRKLLCREDAVLVQNNSVQLNAECVWTDVAAMEDLLKRTLLMGEQNAGRALELANELLDACQGPFAPTEQVAWCVIARERFTATLIACLKQLGSLLESAGEWRGALRIYELGLSHDSLAEPLYRGLMRAHLGLDDRAEGLRAYRRCREMLSIVLSVAPGSETEALYRRIYEDTPGHQPE